MIQNLGKRMEAQTEKIQEMFNKEIEDLKNKQMNTTITELKKTLEGINSRITEVERISELEDRVVEITDTENKEIRMKRNEDSLRDLWDNIKCTNTSIIKVPEEEGKGKGPEKIFEEITAENLPNMGKENSHPSPGSAESPL